jgi:hypothetical protein
MKRKSVKPRATTHFEQISVEIVKKIVVEKPSLKNVEKPSLKKPSGPRNVVAESSVGKTEPYSMPLSSLCWTGR